MRDIVEAFFRERSIVNHHIASFNDFLPTLDHPNSRMQCIVDDLRVGGDMDDEDGIRGVIKLEIDKTGGDTIEIRVGRKRNPKTSAVEPGAKPTITLGEPIVKEAIKTMASRPPKGLKLVKAEDSFTARAFSTGK